MLEKDTLQQHSDIILSHFYQGVVALDLETTGLSPLTDKIIEIAAIKIDENGDQHIFQKLVNPNIKIPQLTIDIHGITDEAVKDAPTLEQVIPEFMEFIGNLPIIAHNAKFDIGYLVCALDQCGISLPGNPAYDSCNLSRHIYRGQKKKENVPVNFKLGTLAEFFNVPLENHHRAEDDAIAALLIFSHGIDILKKRGKTNHIDRAGLLLHIDEFKKLETYELPEELEEILGPMADQTIVEIAYSGGTQPRPPTRPIRPIGFIPTPKGIVLYAQCALSANMKTFPIKRIHAVHLLEPAKIAAYKEELERLKKNKGMV